MTSWSGDKVVKNKTHSILLFHKATPWRNIAWCVMWQNVYTPPSQAMRNPPFIDTFPIETARLFMVFVEDSQSPSALPTTPRRDPCAGCTCQFKKCAKQGMWSEGSSNQLREQRKRVWNAKFEWVCTYKPSLDGGFNTSQTSNCPQMILSTR
jgi:hypothetical protein